MALNSKQGNRPSNGFYLAVPSDSTVLPGWLRGVVCLVAGTLVAVNASGVSVSIPMTVTGVPLPIGPAKIMAASTGTYLLLS